MKGIYFLYSWLCFPALVLRDRWLMSSLLGRTQLAILAWHISGDLWYAMRWWKIKGSKREFPKANIFLWFNTVPYWFIIKRYIFHLINVLFKHILANIKSTIGHILCTLEINKIVSHWLFIFFSSSPLFSTCRENNLSASNVYSHTGHQQLWQQNRTQRLTFMKFLIQLIKKWLYLLLCSGMCSMFWMYYLFFLFFLLRREKRDGGGEKIPSRLYSQLGAQN